FFFFQAEDGIRDFHVTGVQTCALPISSTFLTPTSLDRLTACAVVRLMKLIQAVNKRNIPTRERLSNVPFVTTLLLKLPNLSSKCTSLKGCRSRSRWAASSGAIYLRNSSGS